MAKEKQEKPKQEKAKKEKRQASSGGGGEAPVEQIPGVAPRLAEKYRAEVVPQLMKKFNYTNVNQVPRLLKISMNIGVGDAASDTKLLEAAVRDLEAVVGQKVSITKSRKSISNFKLRENQAIGCRVTLRRGNMYEFFDRLTSLSIPRIRDFRGVPDKSFDGRGNYTMGIKEQIIFPEIDVDKVSRITGMDVTFVTDAPTDAEAYELLKALGMPFRKREGEVKQEG